MTDYGYDTNYGSDELGYDTVDDNKVDYGYDTSIPTDYATVDDNNAYGYETQTDYGYEAQEEYGYEKQEVPQEDYGYGDEGHPVAEIPNKSESRRPKRRCSVTKYTLESSAQSQQDQFNMINQMRNATISTSPDYQKNPEPTPTVASSDDESPTEDKCSPLKETKEPHHDHSQVKGKKVGNTMSKLRKRLSIFG